MSQPADIQDAEIMPTTIGFYIPPSLIDEPHRDEVYRFMPLAHRPSPQPGARDRIAKSISIRCAMAHKAPAAPAPFKDPAEIWPWLQPTRRCWQ